MKTFSLPKIQILVFSFILLPLSTAFASLSDSLLQESGGADFGRNAEAFIQAATFSLLQTQNKVRLQGPFRPYAEVGYNVLSVDDRRLYLFTTNLHSPASFQSVFAKAGIGLPFGFVVEAGDSQVVSEQKANGWFVSVGNQILDLSTVVYIDLVPCVSVNATFLRSFTGPTIDSVAGNLNLGVYHREWLTQLGYIFQYDYSRLQEVGVSKQFIRHGGFLQLPLLKHWFVRTDIFVPSLSASISTGIEF